jgi:hypothetical protein
MMPGCIGQGFWRWLLQNESQVERIALNAALLALGYPVFESMVPCKKYCYNRLAAAQSVKGGNYFSTSA